MKRGFYILCAVVATALASLACANVAAPAPTASPMPAATLAPAVPSATAAVPPASPTAPLPTASAEPTSIPAASPVPGAAVSFDRLSLILPAGVASGATGSLVDKAEGDNVPPWGVAPAHIQLKLDGYALQDKFHQPEIYVYPADEFAQMQNGAAQSLERLRNLLAPNSSVPMTTENLPFVPFFEATQVFAADVKVVLFQHGKGVRELTEYAQYAAPVNNNELIYQFEGLTDDGKYYVIAILPLTAPGLQENAQPGAAVPEGGVPAPDLSSASPDFPGYYAKVQQMLEGLQPGAFTPSLDLLDALIGSMSINTSN